VFQIKQRFVMMSLTKYGRNQFTSKSFKHQYSLKTYPFKFGISCLAREKLINRAEEEIIKLHKQNLKSLSKVFSCINLCCLQRTVEII
jgi:hypothetical protein